MWIKKNTKIYKEKNKKIMDKEKHMAIMVHRYTWTTQNMSTHTFVINFIN